MEAKRACSMAPACMTSIWHDKESNPDTYREEGAEREAFFSI